VVKSILT